jgi:hypothetical protein
LLALRGADATLEPFHSLDGIVHTGQARASNSAACTTRRYVNGTFRCFAARLLGHVHAG